MTPQHRLGLSHKQLGLMVLGSFLLAFGLINLHRPAMITEGGILGLILLLHHHFGLTPAWLALGLNALSYSLAYRIIGKRFLLRSVLAVIPLIVFISLLSRFPLELPSLTKQPLLAAIAAGLLVGLGVGLVVKQGGSTGGDDALAISVTKLTGLSLGWSYFLSDIMVLGLSLSYLPWSRIGYSVVTVAISSLMVEVVRQ